MGALFRAPCKSEGRARERAGRRSIGDHTCLECRLVGNMPVRTRSYREDGDTAEIAAAIETARSMLEELRSELQHIFEVTDYTNYEKVFVEMGDKMLEAGLLNSIDMARTVVSEVFCGDTLISTLCYSKRSDWVRDVLPHMLAATHETGHTFVRGNYLPEELFWCDSLSHPPSRALLLLLARVHSLLYALLLS